MRKIWEAFVDMIIRWLTPEEIEEEVWSAEDICQCGHERCTHVAGRYRCHVGYPPDEKWTHGANCACQIFIPGGRGGDDEGPEPEVPSNEELERIFQK